MNIYTVSSDDDCDNGVDHNVVGSYTTRGAALDACVEYIMWRLTMRDDLAYAMSRDENHPAAEQFFATNRTAWETHVRRGCKLKLMAYLRDVLGGDGCYYVCTPNGDSFHFNVDENELKGELWHTVTWGDSDCEDPEFTTPYPEAFTSEETAVQTFLDYVKDLYRQHHMKWSDEFVRTVKASLKDDGKVQVDLNDGCSVSCVLYHDDAKNIKE